MKIEYKLKDKKVWVGKYRGVDFEINNWPTSYIATKESWTYYLYLSINRIPDEHKPKSFWLRGKKWRSSVGYSEYKHPIIGEIEFHSGVTWYSKISGFDGATKQIKIGCDYQHLWDEGKHYTVESVARDVQGSIDSFLEMVPNYKYWCQGNGKLYDLKEGTLKDGVFISNEWAKRKKTAI